MHGNIFDKLNLGHISLEPYNLFKKNEDEQVKQSVISVDGNLIFKYTNSPRSDQNIFKKFY